MYISCQWTCLFWFTSCCCEQQRLSLERVFFTTHSVTRWMFKETDSCCSGFTRPDMCVLCLWKTCTVRWAGCCFLPSNTHTHSTVCVQDTEEEVKYVSANVLAALAMPLKWDVGVSLCLDTTPHLHIPERICSTFNKPRLWRLWSVNGKGRLISTPWANKGGLKLTLPLTLIAGEKNVICFTKLPSCSWILTIKIIFSHFFYKLWQTDLRIVQNNCVTMILQLIFGNLTQGVNVKFKYFFLDLKSVTRLLSQNPFIGDLNLTHCYHQPEIHMSICWGSSGHHQGFTCHHN